MLLMSVETVEIDILVIGGGGAAARAAVEASDQGASVAVVLKGRIGRSGSTVFPVALHGTFGAATGNDPTDSPEQHFQDIVTNAQGMCDPRLARIMAEESPLALQRLEEFGVPFLKDNNGKHQTWFGCFATRARSHRIVGHGEPIMEALIGQINKRAIRVDEKMLVADLVVQDGKCIGAIAVSPTGKRTIYLAKATILGSGGAGQLFKANINPRDITGDGYVMAYRAGAELVNMEFMQAGIAIVNPLTLVSAWTWAYNPVLINSEGREFLSDYLPPGLSVEKVYQAKAGHFPFSSSDPSRYLEISVLQEMRQGRRVYYDLRKSPRLEEFKETPMYPWLLKRGFDAARETAEISVYAQAVNGGVLINEQAASTLPGLYAAGEVAGGAHGADRLGGGMLSNAQVFGARAGRYATAYANSIPAPLLRPETLEGLSLPDESPEALDSDASSQELRDRIRTLMFDTLLIERSGQKLLAADAELDAIKMGLRKNSPRTWKEFELHSLVEVGKLMIGSALSRQESRGSHYRSDFPERDDRRWRHSIALRREGGQIKTRFVDFEDGA